MRAQYPFTTFLFAAALLAACDMSTSPEPLPDEPEPAVLTVAPSFATIGGERFTRLAALLSGSAAGVPEEMVTWISSDTNVATVARGGLVEARKAGRVLITAKWESARGSATVVVLDQVGKKPTLAAGASLTYRRRARPDCDASLSRLVSGSRTALRSRTGGPLTGSLAGDAWGLSVGEPLRDERGGCGPAEPGAVSIRARAPAPALAAQPALECRALAAHIRPADQGGTRVRLTQLYGLNRSLASKSSKIKNRLPRRSGHGDRAQSAPALPGRSRTARHWPRTAPRW